MKVIKNKDRGVKGDCVRKAFRDMGYKVTELGKYCKWVEVVNGRLQSSYTVYEIDATEAMGNIKVYIMCDSLDRVANELTENKDEVFEYLKKNGWKPEHKWYIEDCGMTEELWRVWNGNGEDGE